MNDKQTEKLEELLTRIVDSHEGYKECAEKTEHARHKTMFQDYADKRGTYIDSVREMLERGGKQIEIDTSFIADARGAYTSLIHKLDKDDDEALLEEICRLEDTLCSAYEEAISELSDQPEELKNLQEQYQEVKTAKDLMEAKEEAA